MVPTGCRANKKEASSPSTSGAVIDWGCPERRDGDSDRWRAVLPTLAWRQWTDRPIATLNQGDTAMTRYERRLYFDRLCELRESYARRGSDDATSVISLESAIEHGTALLEAAVEMAPTPSSESDTGDSA